MFRLRHLLPLSRWAVQHGASYKYTRFDEQDGVCGQVPAPASQRRKRRSKQSLYLGAKMVLLLAAAAICTLLLSRSYAQSEHAPECDSTPKGYQCRPEISHFWGQYTPFYSVESDISSDVPLTCSVTFAQALSRHGARDPTASKTILYNATIQKMHTNVQTYPDKYAFLQNFQYSLGADQLTLFGEQEMIDSGARFYQRYRPLASRLSPFIRSASEDRVVGSALNFTQGFHHAKIADELCEFSDPAYPYPIVIISEATGSNNTLNHGLCTNFEDGPDSTIASDAQKTWANMFVPPIQTRINSDLQGAALTVTEIIYLMDQCPFHTVASPDGTISSFCDLFTEDEWHQYNYYQTLNKFYGYSYGNPLGPTQGVGFTNELIARMTDTTVHDHTSTNHTLDDNPATFPLGMQLYADFSHDNDMTAIFSAVGLYNSTEPLSNTTLTEAGEANGYSASYTVPFAARAYFEKLVCAGYAEEQVRVIVNDRVLPLQQCGGDEWGRCSLSRFIESLSFASSDGLWNQCFV